MSLIDEIKSSDRIFPNFFNTTLLITDDMQAVPNRNVGIPPFSLENSSINKLIFVSSLPQQHIIDKTIINILIIERSLETNRVAITYIDAYTRHQDIFIYNKIDSKYEFVSTTHMDTKINKSELESRIGYNVNLISIRDVGYNYTIYSKLHLLSSLILIKGISDKLINTPDDTLKH